MQGFDERSDEIMDYMDNDRNLSAFKAAEHVAKGLKCATERSAGTRCRGGEGKSV